MFSISIYAQDIICEDANLQTRYYLTNSILVLPFRFIDSQLQPMSTKIIDILPLSFLYCYLKVCYAIILSSHFGPICIWRSQPMEFRFFFKNDVR